MNKLLALADRVEKMNRMLEIAARVEGLTCTDREVDALIWCHVKGIEPRWVGTDCRLLDAGEEGIIGCIDPGKTQRNFSTNRQESGPGSIPAYTASLDAAMTLVPEGYGKRMGGGAVGDQWCEVMRPNRAGIAAEFYASGATLPLALVAASLRARAHGGGEG